MSDDDFAVHLGMYYALEAKKLREIIHIMNEALGDVSYMAHVATHNLNLSDGILNWLIEGEAEKMYQSRKDLHSFENREKMKLLIRFLKWLKTVPEPVRDVLP